MAENLSTEFWDLRFAARRSYFYHEKRVLFWRTILFVAHGMEAALSSTAAAFLFCDGNRTFTQWAVLISAIISFIVVWFGAEKRIQANMEKKARFMELEDSVPLDDCGTAKDLADLKKRRRKIEADDDVVLQCVDALAYNMACTAFGLPVRFRLNWFESSVGRILPIPYSIKEIESKVPNPAPAAPIPPPTNH